MATFFENWDSLMIAADQEDIQYIRSLLPYSDLNHRNEVKFT